MALLGVDWIHRQGGGLDTIDAVALAVQAVGLAGVSDVGIHTRWKGLESGVVVDVRHAHLHNLGRGWWLRDLELNKEIVRAQAGWLSFLNLVLHLPRENRFCKWPVLKIDLWYLGDHGWNVAHFSPRRCLAHFAIRVHDLVRREYLDLWLDAGSLYVFRMAD